MQTFVSKTKYPVGLYFELLEPLEGLLGIGHTGSVAMQVRIGTVILLVPVFGTLVMKPQTQRPQCTRTRAVATMVGGRS